MMVGGEGCILGRTPISRPHLPRNNLLVDLNGLVSEEGWVASSHLVDENPKGPPVHSLVVALGWKGGAGRRKKGEEGAWAEWASGTVGGVGRRLLCSG